MSFENKYIQKKRQSCLAEAPEAGDAHKDEAQVRSSPLARLVPQEDHADRVRQLISNARESPSPCQEASDCAEDDEEDYDDESAQHSQSDNPIQQQTVTQERHQSSSESESAPADSDHIERRDSCSPMAHQRPPQGNFDCEATKNRHAPSHTYSRMIDMFEQKRCLDLGESSNFDSFSNTNLTSKRVDSCLG